MIYFIHYIFPFSLQIWPYGSIPHNTMALNSSQIFSCPNFEAVGNDICDSENDNHNCHYDGVDCCKGNVSWIGDAYCNDVNNNAQCRFDGGDCCLSPVNTFDCSVCECIDTGMKEIINPCPNSASVGNGFCDLQNNNAICNYDGGDCCANSDLIGNDQCDLENYNYVCQYDGGDCCYETDEGHIFQAEYHIINDGKCSYFHNLEMCNFDGGDCCDNFTIADGICDDINNNRLCHYDGGDCCFGNKNTSRCSFCKCFEIYEVQFICIIHISFNR